MGFPHRRRLVTLLDVGLMPSGGGPVEPPVIDLEGLGVWYRADQGPMANVAAQFVAANVEYFSIPTNTSLRFGAIPWTVGGWVWLDTYGIRVLATRCSGPLEMEWQIYTNSSMLVGNTWNGVSHPQVSIGGVLGVSAWYFVVISYDPAGGGVLTIQANNGTPASAVVGATVDHAGGGIMLGANTWGAPGALMDGRQQNWFMFGRALNATERTFLYNAGAGRRYEELDTAFKASLRAWWDLSETSGSRYDRSGNNNTLTDNNTVLSNVGKVANTVTADNAPVSIWEDSGPNDFHLGAVAANNSPTLQSNERNGKAVVRFDGVDDYLQTAPILGSFLCGPTAQTVFIVQMQHSLDTASTTYGWDNTGTGGNNLGAHLKYADNVLYYDTGAATGTGRLTAPAPEPWRGTWHLIEMVRDGSTTNSSFTIEGNPVGITLQPNVPFDSTKTSVLRVGDHAGALYVNDFQGDIAEFIIFNRTLTPAERDTIRNYLKLKWGIAQNKLIAPTLGYLLLNTTTNDRLAIN